MKQTLTSGKWIVTFQGDMEYKNGAYFISADRLKEPDWIPHLAGKNWIDWNEFIPAYLQACENAGIQFVGIRTFWGN